MKETNVKLTKALQAIRAAYIGLMQNEVAELMGISAVQLSNKINGSKGQSFYIRDLRAYLDACGVKSYGIELVGSECLLTVGDVTFRLHVDVDGVKVGN